MSTRKIIRGLVWGAIGLATLIAFFYVEEDWRGAKAWRAAQVEYQQAGYASDFAKFVPPPIPDNQNLAALPLFAQKVNPKWGSLEPFTLEKAVGVEGLPLRPFLGNWQQGKEPNREEMRHYASASYAVVFGNKPPPSSPLSQFEAVYPFIAELRAASVTRSLCRFNFDYENSTALTRSLALLVDQIKVTQLISFDGVLALQEGQFELALGDLRTILILQSGVRRDPSVVAGLVAIGMGALSMAVVQEGLALHAWNEQQLAKLQEEAPRADFLAEYRFVVAGELAAHVQDLPQVAQNLGYKFFPVGLKDDAEGHRMVPFCLPRPAGWLDADAAHFIRFILAAQTVVDPGSHRVYPMRYHSLEEDRTRLLFWGHYVLPWNHLSMEMSMYASNYAPKVAFAQTRADQSVLACALERYRLARGSYPSTLEQLRPAYCATLPTDVINGEPYHYRVLPGGSYRLYSVGWNEKDDGGALVMKTENGRLFIDYDQGDWVWFGPK